MGVGAGAAVARFKGMALLLGLLLVVICGEARAERARLVRDINVQGDPAGDSYPIGFVELGGAVYFLADDGRHGWELWRDDGPSGSRRLVIDLLPGKKGMTLVNEMVTFAGRLYFTASDGVRGCGLWRSDGTAAGTEPVLIVVPGESCERPPWGLPFWLTTSGGRLFFRSGDPDRGTELWSTDGTPAGTGMVADLRADQPPAHSEGSSPRALADLAGTLLFVADADGDRVDELWRSDGTAAGTVRLSDVARPVSSRLQPLDDEVLFFGAGAGRDRTLWRSDGSASGTVPLAEVRIPTDEAPNITTWRGHAYFLALDAAGALALWRSDGTEAGTNPVATDIPHVSPVSYSAAPLVAAGDQLFFTAVHANGIKLWRSDGTPSGTRQVVDLNPSATGRDTADAQHLMAMGGALFFVGSAPDTGCEVWRSDGTTAGTSILVDASSHTDPCDVPLRAPNPGWGRAIGDRLYFRGRDDQHGGEPWTSDGTPNGTRLLTDINPATGRTLGAFSRDWERPNAAVVGERLVFTATDGVDEHLYATDGTSSGTDTLPDVRGGQLIPLGDRLLVVQDDPWGELWGTDGTPAGTARLSTTTPFRVLGVGVGGTALYQTGIGLDRVLWATDGTPQGTIRIGTPDTLEPGPGASAPLGDAIVFVNEHADTGHELWRSDGSADGTQMVADIVPGPNSPGIYPFGELMRVGAQIFFFTTDNPISELALWRTDGTAEGTLDLHAFATSSRLAVVDDRVFFRGWDAEHGEELWVSDGSQAGTRRVADIAPGSADSLPIVGAAHDGALYFIAQQPGSGYQLWRSDGTESGTAPLRDSAGSRLPVHPDPPFASLPDALVFVTDDGVHGAELWRTDGTDDGTFLIRDIDPAGASLDHDPWLTRFGDHVLFYADDGVHGSEPWITDGSHAGTRLLADVAPRTLSSRDVDNVGRAGPFHSLGDRILFVADDRTHGLELWEVTPGAPSCIGDCDGGGAVTINELIQGVAIALGAAQPSQCLGLDISGEGRVTVDELVAAVRAALGECG